MAKTKDKLKKKSQAFIKDMSYNMGSISRSAVERLKKLTEADIYRQLGRDAGVFQDDIKTGWSSPEKIIVKDAIKIKGSPFGIIIGSFARYTAEGLGKGCKTTGCFLGKVYKEGRIAILVKMWRLEHQDATKTEEEMAVRKIEQLFNDR